MNPEEAFNAVNRLFVEKTKRNLSDCQKAIILGIWQGKTYQVIDDETGWSIAHIKAEASKLFKQLGKILEVKVSNINFVNTVEQLYKQNPVETPPTQRCLPELDNPFIPQNGGIDNPQLFFDRSQKIRRIIEVLNSGSNVALIGEVGIGKSSLLHAICRLAESQLILPRQPVFLDLNRIHDEDDFYYAFCSEANIPECIGYKITKNLGSKKVLLALDHVGQMPAFTRQVRDRLRGLAEGGNAPLKLVLAANLSLNTLFNDSQEGVNTSPLAGVCIEEQIEAWDEITSCDFIKARLARTTVRFTEEEVNKLVQESGGHPGRLMRSCYRLYAGYRDGL
jgi:hypothetical protein